MPLDFVSQGVVRVRREMVAVPLDVYPLLLCVQSLRATLTSGMQGRAQKLVITGKL